jgi:hypothetical protein
MLQALVDSLPWWHSLIQPLVQPATRAAPTELVVSIASDPWWRILIDAIAAASTIAVSVFAWQEHRRADRAEKALAAERRRARERAIQRIPVNAERFRTRLIFLTNQLQSGEVRAWATAARDELLTLDQLLQGIIADVTQNEMRELETTLDGVDQSFRIILDAVRLYVDAVRRGDGEGIELATRYHLSKVHPEMGICIARVHDLERGASAIRERLDAERMERRHAKHPPIFALPG